MSKVLGRELIGTKNAPSRYGDKDNDHDFQGLADLGCSVLAGEEIQDSDKDYAPRGWIAHRPPQVRSEFLTWDPDVWRRTRSGADLISSPLAPAPRFVLWATLKHKETGVIRTFGVSHFIAFKTQDQRHATEFRHQEYQAALWLHHHPRGVLMGDLNAERDSRWLYTLGQIGNFHTPVTKSGPHDDGIDLIVTNRKIPHARRARALKGYDGDHKPVVAYLPLTHLKES